MGSTADLGPHQVGFQFFAHFRMASRVLHIRVPGDLVPKWRLYFARSEETTACESVKVCLCSLVSYDDPQCKALPEARVPAVQ